MRESREYEVSCGAVVFTRDGGAPRYVIVRQLEGFFSFPKGHMEPGESEAETALREIREEVGLQVQLLPGFRTVEEHPLPRKPGVMKRVIYFLAEYSGQQPMHQPEELLEARTAGFEEALELLTYENTKEILRRAHAALLIRCAE